MTISVFSHLRHADFEKCAPRKREAASTPRGGERAKARESAGKEVRSFGESLADNFIPSGAELTRDSSVFSQKCRGYEKSQSST